MTTVHEWRVTGTSVWPDGDEKPYTFTWRSDVHPDPEASARTFIASDHVQSSIRDIKLTHRMVQYGDWELM